MKHRVSPAELLVVLAVCGACAPKPEGRVRSKSFLDDAGGVEATPNDTHDRALDARVPAVEVREGDAAGATSTDGGVRVDCVQSNTALDAGGTVTSGQASDAGPTSSSGVSSSLVTERRVLARGEGLRVETISSDGRWIVYTQPANSIPSEVYCNSDSFECYTGVRLFAVSTQDGHVITLDDSVDLAFARFVGTTLFVFRGEARVPEALGGLLDDGAELLAWRPGDEGLTSIGVHVDPGAFRASRDARWVTAEINDTIGDAVVTAEVVLIDVATLDTRSLLVGDHVRARFTRDSKWVFVGSREESVTTKAFVDGFSLNDFQRHSVGAIAEEKWKLSHDGNWLVYSSDLGLMRKPASGGEEALVASANIASYGMQFDVGHEGDLVSFVQSGTPNGLFVVGLQGGEVTTLQSQVYVELLAHYNNVIVYAKRVEDPLFRLEAVSASGGTTQDLGPFWAGPAESYVLDQSNDSLIVRDALGVTRWMPSVSSVPIELTTSGRGGKFLRDGRVVFLQDSVKDEQQLELLPVPAGRILELKGNGTLLLAEESGFSLLERTVTGPFALEPEYSRWYVTTVAGDNGTELVADVVP